MKISTIAVHGGLTDTSHYAAAFPVYLTSTFIQKGPTEFREYGYSRTANPTRSDVEKHAADIEGAKHGIATATGMAAVSLVFETLNAGDRVLISNNVYGGTWLYATELFKKRGVEFTVVDDFNTYDFETAPADVKLVYIETPSNPLLEVTDIAHVAKAAKARSWLLAVDNTFLTGVNQRPLDLGADVVIYSATKYYGGHSDLLAGLVVLNDDKLYEKLKLYSKALGGVLDPFDSFLLERGIKTLPLRLARHEENTHAIARYLSAHPGVEAVFYPGLESDPGYAVNRRQSKGAGGVLSFRFNEEQNIRFNELLCKAGLEHNRSRFIVKRIFGEEFVVVRRDPSKVQFVARLNDFYFQFQKLGNNYNQVVKAVNTHFSNVAIPHQIAMLEQRTRELKTLSIEILNPAKQAKEWLRI